MNCRLRPREDNFGNRLEILKPGEARILLVFWSDLANVR